MTTNFVKDKADRCGFVKDLAEKFHLNVNVQDQFGDTPLYCLISAEEDYFSSKDKLELAKCLLASGASLKNSQDLLEAAMIGHNVELFVWLIDEMALTPLITKSLKPLGF